MEVASSLLFNTSVHMAAFRRGRVPETAPACAHAYMHLCNRLTHGARGGLEGDEKLAKTLFALCPPEMAL